MSEIRERRKNDNKHSESDSDSASICSKDSSSKRGVKKVVPDQSWVQKLTSDLLNSSNKINRDTKYKDNSIYNLNSNSYWLTRIFFLRFLSFIYLVGFLVSFNQNKELIGNNGLTPARNFLLNGKGQMF